MTSTTTEAEKPPIRLKVPDPHEGQEIVRAATKSARFVVLSCGRRWGKTTFAVCAAIAAAVAAPNQTIWWVGPTYELAEIGWELLRDLLSSLIDEDLVLLSKSKRRLTFANGSTISVKTANSISGLRGRGLDFLVVDEAGFILREVWTKQLRPTLIDRQGRALIISTPTGMGTWFHDLWLRGQEPGQKRFRSFKFPTWTNPYIQPEEIEEAREQMPQDAFDQEIAADFLASDAGVFRALDKIFFDTLKLRPGFKHLDYVIGWDIAKLRDWSAWTIIEKKERAVVHVTRERGMDYPDQVEKCRELQRQYPGVVVFDGTGVGVPVGDWLLRRGVICEPFNFTGPAKRQLVGNAILATEGARVKIPLVPETEVLKNELQNYRYQMNPHGGLTYGAPPGFFDDAATSFMLALWGLTMARVTVVSGPTGSGAPYFGSKALRGL